MNAKQTLSRLIRRAAQRNPMINGNTLLDEMERGDIDGWMKQVTEAGATFAEWSGAMTEVASELHEAAMARHFND